VRGVVVWVALVDYGDIRWVSVFAVVFDCSVRVGCVGACDVAGCRCVQERIGECETAWEEEGGDKRSDLGKHR
jgi:hypothetical protein